MTGGQHAGQTGMVVKAEGKVCTLISDTTKKELNCFAKDLSESMDVSMGLDKCALPPLCVLLRAGRLACHPTDAWRADSGTMSCMTWWFWISRPQASSSAWRGTVAGF